MDAEQNAPTTLVPEIDWEAQGIETELGWSLQAVYQGFARSATGAVASVPANRLGIDKTAMTYVIDALENSGLVERRPDPRDRRVREVHPTAAGRRLLSKARVALREVEDVLMRDLDDDERMQLRHLLARVALGAGDIVAGLPAADTTLEQPVSAPERSRRAATTDPQRNRDTRS
jgi:DNA-binding MarR family transcriptional regulator